MKVAIALRGACLAAVLGPNLALAQTAKQSNAGDSISQAFSADGILGDHPRYSWVQGTNAAVNSIYLRYRARNPSWQQEPESVTGAELVGGPDSFAAQSQRICSQTVRPSVVEILLGGNDVCNRAKSTTADAALNMYSVVTVVNGLRAGLDQLAACLPQGSKVQMISVPRVDFLYLAGVGKSFLCPAVVWPTARICRIVTGETNAARRAQIGARINQYNQAISDEIGKYDRNSNGRNPRRIRFVSDWKGSIEGGNANTSIGAYQFGPGDINAVDCFHPNVAAQGKLACAAWASSPDGSGDVIACMK